ncbi:hypothetical protein E4T47_05547 [Aureobasidium subglaciale]|nr:hypothetical protein E4T47_05547 [Aureobasidium subglaciale]
MASEAYLRLPQPRRPAAGRSVSLRHHKEISPPESKITRSTQTDASSGSPSSNKPNVSKADSGESSNADNWFAGANNNTAGKNNTVVDNDPPFFLQHSSSEETPNYGGPGAIVTQGIPSHALLQKNDTEDSGSSGDFRAVIDDLTVQNKKLKRRLKKYEKLHDAHLKDEKLFEVRVHGLSSNKRRELEDILRNFAVGAAAQPNATTTSQTSNLYDRVVPTLKTHKTASSSSNFADSAYVSNSASASATSNSNSGQHSRPSYRRSNQSRTSNIQTYLHDIPEGLLPQHPAAMTEYSKKKLVVRRLEQIFAGTGAGLGDHHHPMQQQEVSQMAAKADRSALEATGQLAKIEGNREAPIMKDDEDRSAEESPMHQGGLESTQGIQADQKIVEQDFEGHSPQQRPTRPLDLDPHRAQNPSENFQYIRHLGFSPPEPTTMKSPEEGHGWIYLNFLFNMAQLHTLNVTPEFAKKALMDFSTKFELSEDGRKVRWKGGRSITRSASDLDGSSPSTYGNSPNGTSPQKRSKSSHHLAGAKSAKRRMLEKQENKFAYTPLFFHRSSEDDSDISSEEEDDTESQFLAPPPGGDSSAMTSSGIRTVSLRQKKKAATDNGPIIFYNNARFCTDLSGEPKTETTMMYNPILYHTTTGHALGIPNVLEADHGVLESRGPLDQAKDLPEAMCLNDNPIPEALEVNFPGTSPLSSASGASGPARSPIDLEVSGIGGIYPSDNFSINVKTQRKRTASWTESVEKKPYAPRIAELFKDSKQQSAPYKEDVVKTFHQELPPSELPPAFCFMDVDEYDDDETDSGDYQSIIPDMDRIHDVPATAPQTIDMPYMSSDESDDEAAKDEDDDDAASDGSLDLLATARKLDPHSIQAREREYDAHMAERLAEEIPAGSSAATAGGGSGFASPVAGVSRKEYEAARKEHARRHASTIASVASFARTDTNGSMVVNGKSP